VNERTKRPPKRLPAPKAKARPARSVRSLARLLDARNEHPERIAQLDAQIRTEFEEVHAILVLDMCGFSRLTIRHGIIHYLALIRRMQAVVLPELNRGGGRLVKAEADNVFAVFPTPVKAARCAMRIQRELARHNRALPEDWDVHVGIGIGYGPLLMVGEHDLYGSEMNLASKLGEDLAEAGDVLVTEAAQARLGALGPRFAAAKARLSGMNIRYYRLSTRP
jgi:adenylate cyclase